MTEVPSVNPEPKPVPESEASDASWVDPMFIEKAQPLADEPQPEPEAETKPGDLTPEQIKALLDANPEAGEAAKPEEGDDDGDDEEGEQGEEAADSDKDQQPADKRPRRRSKARRERREMQRKLAEMQARLDALAKPTEEATPAEQAAPEPPKLEDFEYDTEKWAAAVTDWTKKLVESGKEDARKAEEAKTRETAEQARREALETFQKRADDARDKYGDDEYDAAYEKASHVYLPDSVADLIIASDVGPEIAYWLGTHDEEAAKFKDMTEAQIAREVGRIEARIAAEQAKAAGPKAQAGEEDETGAGEAKPAAEAKATPNSPPPQRKPVTKAPDPVPTVSGGAAHGRDPSKMSQDEYKAARMSGQLR